MCKKLENVVVKKTLLWLASSSRLLGLHKSDSISVKTQL